MKVVEETLGNGYVNYLGSIALNHFGLFGYQSILLIIVVFGAWEWRARKPKYFLELSRYIGCF
jgi:hypothetical protein